MTTTLPSNGSQRKTLASQLDRLDGILDVLGEGLNEAVAAAVQNAVERAVQQAVQQAVQGLVAEVLTNPDALALLRVALSPSAPVADVVATPATPPVPDRSRSGGFAGWLLRRARQSCQAAGAVALRCAAAAREGLRLVKPYRRPLLLAAGVGTVVAVAACAAGPWVAAPTSWVAGFGTTLAVRASSALKRTFGFAPTMA
jgi:hypothetical protein